MEALDVVVVDECGTSEYDHFRYQHSKWSVLTSPTQFRESTCGRHYSCGLALKSKEVNNEPWYTCHAVASVRPVWTPRIPWCCDLRRSNWVQGCCCGDYHVSSHNHAFMWKAIKSSMCPRNHRLWTILGLLIRTIVLSTILSAIISLIYISHI